MNEKQSFIYILFSKRNGTLYTGVTTNLQTRIYQHKHDEVDGFSKKYHVHNLGYYEIYYEIHDAIAREKQIKGWSRKKKLDLIESINPDWRDLYGELFPDR